MKIINFLRNTAGAIIAIGLIGYLAVTASLTSCQKEDLTQERQTDAFIEECRTFYDGLFKGDEPLSTNHNEQAKGNLSFPKRTPRWEQALARSITIGQSVAVPLNYEGSPFVRTSVNPNDLSMEAISYLLIYKDKKKAMHAEVVYLLRDGYSSASSEAASSGFTGAIYVEDLKGNYLKGYLCLPEGRILRLGTPSTKEVPSNAGPQNSPVKVECVTVSFYRRYSLDGGVTWSAPILQSTRIECSLSVFYNGDDGGSGGSPEDYIPGGGSEGDSTTPSVNPLVKNVNNPCEQVKSISSDSEYRSIIKTLFGKTNGDQEFAYTASIVSNYSTSIFNFSSIIEGNHGENSMSIPNVKMDAFFHSHYSGLDPIFTASDVWAVYTIYKNGNISNLKTFTAGVVGSNGVTYILKITDESTFKSFFSNLTASNIVQMDLDLQGYITLGIGEKGFLTKFGNAGVVLLKSTSITQISFGKRTVDSTGKVIYTNC